MASEPEESVVCAYSKDISLGYLYDPSTKKYSPGDTRHAINTEKCKPQYEIRIKSKEEISNGVKKSKLLNNTPWGNDFTNTNFLEYILLQGRKICECKGNVEPHTKLHVVSSVYYMSFIDVLICFDHEIEDKDMADLKNYIESLKEMKISEDIQNRGEGTDSNKDQPDSTVAYIPTRVDGAFSVGYIYATGKRTEASSVKYVLEEFCNYLVHSNTGKFPVNCKVKKPLHPLVSYASVVKNETTVCVADRIHVLQSQLNQPYCTGGAPDNASHVVKPKMHEHSELNRPCHTGGAPANATHVGKPSQRDELPVAHNTQSNTRLRETTIDRINAVQSQLNQPYHTGRAPDNTSHVVKPKICEHSELNMPCHTGGAPANAADVRKPSQRDKLPVAHNAQSNTRLRETTTDRIHAVQSQLNQPYHTGGAPNNAAHVGKPSQRDELPVAHNTRSNTRLRETTTLSPHCNVTMKNSEQNENLADRNTYLPRTDKNLSVYCHVEQNPINHEVNDRKSAFSEKQVDMKGEQQVIPHHQGEEGKSCPNKDNEVHNTFEAPLDASSQYSRKNTISQSSQNSTTPECVQLDTYILKNFKRDEPESHDSTVQRRAQEVQFQHKTNLPDSTCVGNVNVSEKQGSVERNQLKFEHKAGKVMPEKSLSNRPNPPEFNSSSAESSMLLVPVKETEVCGIVRKFYGVVPEAEGKTIILLGASGSGKTTLVNFIANYFIGNRKASGKLMQVARNSNDIQGHTTRITAYTFCESKDFPFTIIDTPGLNDSSGAEVHDHVQSLKTFLANVDSQNLRIHAIGFVAQAHIVRLTSSERLVMDYISSLFGKEIGKHVVSFITFSDNQEAPPVVEAINRYGVSCSVFLKFNNSALSNNKEEEIDELDKIYWRIGCKSWKKCIKLLGNLPSLSFKSLTDEIYVTQIMEVAERDLMTEIMAFMNCRRKNKVVNKEVLNNAERVWVLAETVKELRLIQTSQCSSVNDILLNYVEICASQNSYWSTKECMELLSLSPSRPLLKAGLAIVSSVAPIYNSVKQICGSSRERKTDPLDMLFCLVCKKDHVLKRIETRTWKNTVLTNKNIGYQCKDCKCPGDVHGNKNEDEEYEHPESCGFTPGKLLQHTRNNIEKVLGDLCLPGYEIQENEYIKWLKHFAKQEAQQFCNDLIGIQ